MFKKFFSKLSKRVGIDLGTSKTILSVQEKGIVMKEPSIVAINNKTDQILAVGEEAQKMIGKNPKFITLAYPLVNGIISDFEVTEKFLKYFIDKLFMENLNLAGRPSVVIGIPLDVTEVEKKAVEDASLSAGAGKVYLVEEIIAAAIGARLPIQDASGSMIVNLGGGKTEIAVISLNGVVNWRSVNVAGKELDNDIVQYARSHFNLLIGHRVAENIKIKIGSAFELKEELKMEMRGRDLISGLPREIIVTDYQIRDAISKSVATLVDYIKATLETTPPELVADIYERGIVLTGGGAQLKGLDQAIAKAAEIPVRVADDPATSTIRGLTTLLDDDQLLKEILLPSANEEKMVR
ncbi:TPA: rod shape-determining protein [Candidatus Falkowbacteria bacterium]|nr:rod shape-determining protein [Candidatus Falkowbacteria bacterium]